MPSAKEECAVCKAIFPSTADLEQHQVIQHTVGIEQNICKICSTNFTEMRLLEIHQEYCYTRVCIICGDTFTNPTTFVAHTRIHNPPSRPILGIYKCEYCSRLYRYPAELRTHLLDHTTGKRYIYLHYGNMKLSFRSKSISAHLQHMNSRTYQDKQKKILQTHYRVKCSVCNKSFRSKVQLLSHIRSHFNEKLDEKRLPKKIAAIKHTNKYTAIEHTFTYPSENSDEYNKVISEQFGELLNNSIEKSTDFKKYYSEQSDVLPQESTHIVETTYDCRDCSASFSEKSALKHHNCNNIVCKTEESLNDINKSSVEKSALPRHPFDGYASCNSRLPEKPVSISILKQTDEKIYECKKTNKLKQKKSKKLSLPEHRNIYRDTNASNQSQDAEISSSDFNKTSPEKFAPGESRKTNANAKTFQCTDCSQSFTELSTLMEHKESHAAEIACTEFKFDNAVDSLIHSLEKTYGYIDRSNTQYSLLENESTPNVETTYQCTDNNMSFSDSPARKENKCTNSIKTKYKCTKCNRSFSRQSALTHHTQMTHIDDEKGHKCINSNGKKYKCTECNKRFSKQKTLTKHKQTHTNAKTYESKDCKQSFKKQSTLIENKYSAEITCAGFIKTSSEKSAAIDHTVDSLIHSELVNSSKYERKGRNKGISNKATLKEHKGTSKKTLNSVLKERNQTDAKHYMRTDCDKSFSDKPTPKEYKCAKSTEQPFKCSVCDKTFPLRSALIAHNKQTHVKSKIYECTDCNNNFSDNSTLRDHKCTSEEPFKCSTCKKAFPLRSALIAHNKQTHGGPKPYGCTDCKKSFSDKSTLKEHKCFDTSDIIDDCEDCNKSLSDKSTLKAHKCIESSNRAYKCTVCDTSFSNKPSLNDHTCTNTTKKRNYRVLTASKVFQESQL